MDRKNRINVMANLKYRIVAAVLVFLTGSSALAEVIDRPDWRRDENQHHKRIDFVFSLELPQIESAWISGDKTSQSQHVLSQSTISEKADFPKQTRLFNNISIIRLLEALDMKYEHFEFKSKVTTERSKSSLSFSGFPTGLYSGNGIEGDTTFERWTIKKNKKDEKTIPDYDESVGIGVFCLQFQKPYSMSLGGSRVSNPSHESDLSAYGLSVCFDTKGVYKLNSLNNFYITSSVNFDVGLGVIAFAEKAEIRKFLKHYNWIYYYGMVSEFGIHYEIASFALEIMAAYCYYSFSPADEVNGKSSSFIASGELDMAHKKVFSINAGISYAFM